MMASRKRASTLGKQGEKFAQNYLWRAGYQIRDTNWHCVRGELDIVATKDDLLVFVEVKTRKQSEWEEALMSITPRKRERLIATIYHYLDAKGLEEAAWRMDVIIVLWAANAEPQFQHIEDALVW